jgi:6-pyruvoyltetrahydropterin/6-carboxytetrahydropterin synthase
LILQDGSKESVHNHNWSVTADVSSHKLNSMGLVMDFNQLKVLIDKTVAAFDNKVLNEISYFQHNNPSAENVAKYIYEKLRIKLPQDVELRNIKVVEEPGCLAKFGE